VNSKLLIVIAISLTLPACAFGPELLEGSSLELLDKEGSTEAEETCTRTMCLTGAIWREDGGNWAFDLLCEDELVEGLIRECTDEGCYPTWENFDPFIFGLDLESDVYPHLFDAMDDTGDGLVDELDESCDLQLFGYSWGGVNAARLADMFINDPAVSLERARVASLIVIDPFRTTGFGTHWSSFVVPAGVERFRSYRHSVSLTSYDCSSQAFRGPYVGLPAEIEGADTDAADYDYSLAPDTYFPRQNLGSIPTRGRDVGHCSVLHVAAHAVLNDLAGVPFDELPPDTLWSSDLTIE